MKEDYNKLKRSNKCQPFMHIDEEANDDGSPMNSRTGVNDLCELDIRNNTVVTAVFELQLNETVFNT
jgi:hypothetical protein